MAKSIDELKIELVKAQAAKTDKAAKLKDLELKEKKGQLVQKSDVKADAEAVGAAVRRGLEALPRRAAALCVGKDEREILVILEREIVDICAQIKSAYMKG